MCETSSAAEKSYIMRAASGVSAQGEKQVEDVWVGAKVHRTPCTQATARVRMWGGILNYKVIATGEGIPSIGFD